MKVGLLTIGDELLSGSTQDTNSQALAKILFREGTFTTKFVTCGDHDIVKHLEEMTRECQIVITSGGLGPTHDDMTAESVARFLRVKMHTSEDVMRDLVNRFPQFIDDLEGVARIPEGALPLINCVGSAPGFIVSSDTGKTIVSLPGVPYECKAMAETYLPKIIEERKGSLGGIYSRAMHFCHAREDTIAPVVSGLNMAFPDLEFGIYPKTGSVSVTFRGEAANSEDFQQKIQEVIETLYEKFSTLIYPSEHGSVIEAVLAELKARKKTVALAESCTGGEMAASLTKIPGASEVFPLGVVTYSNASKHKLLGVSSQTLERYGAVSEQVVIEMVEGLFKISGADFVMAVSGIAGPDGGTREKPVGTIFAALGEEGGKIYTGLVPVTAGMTREFIIKKTTNYMFGALWRHLAYDICPFT